MGLLAFFLAWFAYDVAIRTDTLVIWSHVKQGGCLDDFNTAMDRCRYDKHPDAEKCIMATAALRRCFARKPDHFGSHFTDRLDKGLDEDLNPTPQQIERDERRGTYRWWAGMRRTLS
jgi:hypothetical protein